MAERTVRYTERTVRYTLNPRSGIVPPKDQVGSLPRLTRQRRRIDLFGVAAHWRLNTSRRCAFVTVSFEKANAAWDHGPVELEFLLRLKYPLLICTNWWRNLAIVSNCIAE